MMIHHQKELKLADEDANTRINLNSISGIYLTATKVAQCRHVAANRREMNEAKKITAKKTVTRKVILQLKSVGRYSESPDRWLCEP